MLAFISRLVLQLATIRWLFKLGWLGLLLPIAALLKVVGIPLLLILLVLGLPILLLLFLFGLPIIAVLLVGGLIMGLLGMVLSIGLVAVKIAIFVVLPIWLMWRLACWVFSWGSGRDFRWRGTDGDDSTPPSVSTDPTNDPPVDEVDGIDPAV